MAQDTAVTRVEALPKAEIDFAILADRTEVINNKLYMMGGGWDVTAVLDFKLPIPYSLAISVLIPWHEANEVHQLTMHIEGPDAVMVTPELQANVAVGRPPQAIRGQSFRALLSISGHVLLPKPDTYVIVVRLASGHSKRVVFNAVQAQGFMPTPTS